MKGEAKTGRRSGRLTAKSLQRLVGIVKLHADGDGLYLQVRTSGKGSWLYRYEGAGGERRMGLGAYPPISLADARKLRDAAKGLRQKGVDPIDARRAEKHGQVPGVGMTFRAAAERYMTNHRAEWSDPKHADQWRNTLTTYAYDVFGDKIAREVTRDDVLAVLRPIWTKKTETANRLRGRIENILEAASVAENWNGWINPADWKPLKHDLAAPSKVAPVVHHPAVDFKDAPDVVRMVKAKSGVGALALTFCILTSARSQMVIGALWDEMDLVEGVWTVPTYRLVGAHERHTAGPSPGASADMVGAGTPRGQRSRTRKGSGLKGQEPMRIPLSAPALAILKQVRLLRRSDGDDYVFPGTKAGRPMSSATMSKVLQSVVPGVTVHGWRSTMRDWAGETTNHPSEIAEAALHHDLPGGKTRKAYQRGELYDKRRSLMDDWAAYLLTDR